MSLADALAGTPAWIVGGTIRDELLGRSVKDVDIAVGGDPEPAARALAAALQIHATKRGSGSSSRSSSGFRSVENQEFAAGFHQRGDFIGARSIADLEGSFEVPCDHDEYGIPVILSAKPGGSTTAPPGSPPRR